MDVGEITRQQMTENQSGYMVTIEYVVVLESLCAARQGGGEPFRSRRTSSGETVAKSFDPLNFHSISDCGVKTKCQFTPLCYKTGMLRCLLTH